MPSSNSFVKIENYEDLLMQKFESMVKICWSFLFFTLKSQEEKKINFDMLTRLILNINTLIRELDGAKNVFDFHEIYKKFCLQINYFLRIDGKNLVPY
jgi:hypothetical protein